jgi:hypothetical protein
MQQHSTNNSQNLEEKCGEKMERAIKKGRKK